MSAGLAALLDDVAVLTRAAAASVDDVAAGAGRASMKAAGVIVDDAAVTPRYVQGFRAERELPMIKRIAAGSLRNKLLFILPAALLLSEFLDWLLTPILMLGGAYLCYEAAEKIWEKISPHHHDVETPVGAQGPEQEDEFVGGAIRTDFILSAEIMVISLNEVTDEAFLSRALILVVVAFAITAVVYGAVALIVKMDDVGLHLAQERDGAAASFGRGLVRAMPVNIAVTPPRALRKSTCRVSIAETSAPGPIRRKSETGSMTTTAGSNSLTERCIANRWPSRPSTLGRKHSNRSRLASIARCRSMPTEDMLRTISAWDSSNAKYNARSPRRQVASQNCAARVDLPVPAVPLTSTVLPL